MADVAAHVIGQLTDVVNLRLDGLGTPEVTGRQVEERRGDTFLHADDITSALGVPGRRDPGAVQASVSHIAQVLTDQGWGPAELRLAGLPEFPASGGGGHVVRGDPMEFVLVATGRADPAPFGLEPTVNIYR